MRNIPQKLDDVYWAFAIYPSTADYAFQVLNVLMHSRLDYGMPWWALQRGPGGPTAHPKFWLGGPQCIWPHQ